MQHSRAILFQMTSSIFECEQMLSELEIGQSRWGESVVKALGDNGSMDAIVENVFIRVVRRRIDRTFRPKIGWR